jgi:hypothetical protein
MKKLLFLFTIVIILIPNFCFAAINASDIIKTEIPGLKLTDPVVIEKAQIVDNVMVQSETLAIPWIAQYIAGIYRYAVVLGSVIAATVLVIGGFMYASSAGKADRVKKANDMMIGSVTGLVLLLGTFLFLNILNKDLTNLRAIEIKTVKRIEIPDKEVHEDCNTFSDSPYDVFRNINQTAYNSYTLTAIEINDRFITLRSIGSNHYLQTKAADDFKAWMAEFVSKGNPRISINSAFRSSAKQSCLRTNLLHPTTKRPLAAASCKSNHEIGLAVDIGVSKLNIDQYKALIETGLNHNFKNYFGYESKEAVSEDYIKPESWHFDYKGTDGIVKEGGGVGQDGTWCFYNPVCCPK